MRKLKLIRPWALSAVRQKLAAQPAAPCLLHLQAPAPVRSEMTEASNRNMTDGCNIGMQACCTPCERLSRPGAPERRPIFAATAAPHLGCPHLFS